MPSACLIEVSPPSQNHRSSYMQNRSNRDFWVCCSPGYLTQLLDEVAYRKENLRDDIPYRNVLWTTTTEASLVSEIVAGIKAVVRAAEMVWITEVDGVTAVLWWWWCLGRQRGLGRRRWRWRLLWWRRWLCKTMRFGWFLFSWFGAIFRLTFVVWHVYHIVFWLGLILMTAFLPMLDLTLMISVLARLFLKMRSCS